MRADRRALFAKRRCVDGLPDVQPRDPAQICYAAGASGSLQGETVLQGDLADALLGVIAAGSRRGEALLAYFPSDRGALQSAGRPITRLEPARSQS